MPYVSVTDDSLLPSRNFQPFFALVDDASSGDVAHPAVHYVFDDDDPDVVTAASLRALGADDASVTTMRRVSSELDGEVGAPEEPRDVLPPLRPGVLERYVLVDMAQDGHTVVSAKSLSTDWAVTGTSVGAAPTFDEGAGRDPGQAGGLMLKVEGLSTNVDLLRKRDRDADREFEEKREAAGGDTIAAMTQLVEGLRKKMLVLDKVMLDSEDGTEES